MLLGIKQRASHESFVAVLERIEDIVPRERYEALLDRTVKSLKENARGRIAYGWSGGKDSIALKAVCDRADIQKCVFGMTDHLEYPEFLCWVTDNMPPELTIVKNDWDLDWLGDHLEMLFPRNAKIAAKWFKGVQHHAQEQYYRKHNLDVLLLGRRRMDGNFRGPNGQTTYVSRGITRHNPIFAWTHEEVLASLVYEGLRDNLPPFYHWPGGYRCGTHAWPARQYCRSIADGWGEVNSIDHSIVVKAAQRIQSARAYLESL